MTCECSASAASRAPTSRAARPPTPASTSSKTKVGGRLGAFGRAASTTERTTVGPDDLEGEHDTRQLTAGGGLGHRAWRSAAVGREQDLHVVDPQARQANSLAARQLDAIGVEPMAHGDLDDGAAHREVRELLRHPRAEVGGRPAPQLRELHATPRRGRRAARRPRPRGR